MAVVIVTITSEPWIIGTMIREELLALSCAVESGGLDDLGGHALDGRRQDDHREAGLEPDEDDDERERVEAEVGVWIHVTGSRRCPPTALRRPYCGWPGGRHV